jgi:hypothetical protein
MNEQTTIERTALVGGQRINTLPTEFHADRYRGATIFTYRNYGCDITERLLAVGFVQARIELPGKRLLGFSRPVVVAQKPV